MATSYLKDTYLDEAQKDLPESDPRNANVVDELYRRAAAASSAPATDQGGYSQVDLRPDWYKKFITDKGVDQNGPPLTSTAGDVAGAVAQAGAQGAQANAERFAQLPGASAQSIMRMQRKANGMGGLAAGLGALLSKQSRDFDTQQARAVKDTQSLRKNQKTGMSNNELLGLANLNKTTLRNEQLERKQQEANAQTLALTSPESPESRSEQQAAVQSGMFTPEEATKLSAKQIKEWRTSHMQTQAQGNKTNEFDYEHAVNEGAKIGAESRANTARVETEQREQELKNLQAVIPGRKWAHDVPPPPEVQTKVREYSAAQQEMINGAREMTDIQRQLSEIPGAAGLSPAAVGQYVDKYLGDKRSKNLLARAQLLQKNMVTASRILDRTGVLQQYEKAMEEAVNPQAGTIGGYFTGNAQWDAAADIYSRYGEHQLQLMGSWGESDPNRPQGGNTLMTKPASEQVTQYAAPVARRPTPGRPAQAQTQGDDYGVQPGDSLGAPQAVPAQAPMGQSAPHQREGADNNSQLNGNWIVEVNGKQSKPRQLTKEQYQMLVQKYGNANVKRAQ